MPQNPSRLPDALSGAIHAVLGSFFVPDPLIETRQHRQRAQFSLTS